MRKRLLCLVMSLSFYLVFFCVPLRAQVDTGRISGLVSDTSGAVVPGATVTLTNQGMGLRLTMKAGGTGYYMFPGLKVGTYSVEIEAPGFAKFLQLGIPLNIQQDVVINAILKPGSITQTVEVTGAAPLLQTQDASRGNVIGANSINGLPLNGRNYTFLAQLAVGVNVAQMDSRGLTATGSFAANGTTPEQNNYLLDGIDNNSAESDWLAGTNYTYKPAVDAIQEFKIQTSNYSAEFGRSAGAVLNATIKSGTNRLHGDVWEFLRNDKLDAANFFENSTGILKGEFRQNQFGGTLGGPIAIPHVYKGKDKTWFFVDYEGTRIHQAAPQTASVPTARTVSSNFTDLSDLTKLQSGTRTDMLARTFPLGQVFDPATTRAVTKGQLDPVTGLVATGNGYAREPFAGNLLPAGRLDPNAIKLLRLYPTPNQPGLVNNYATDPVSTDTTDQGDVRIDHNFSEKDQVFGRVSSAQEVVSNPGPMGGLADGGGYTQSITTNNTNSDMLSWTHTFSPRLINELRLGVTRISTPRVQFNGTNLTNIPAQFGIPGVPQVTNNGGLPPITPTGLTELGAAAYLPTTEISQNSQLQENMTMILGKHTLKGGFQFQHIKYEQAGIPYGRGGFSFSGNYTEVPATSGGNTGLAQMLLTPTASTVPGGFDNVGGASTINASNFHPQDVLRNAEGAYFQDSWKVSSKLTVDLGVRWEYQGLYVGAFDNITNWHPAALGQPSVFVMTQHHCKEGLSPSFLTLTAKDGINIACSTNPMLVNPDKADFAPRVGLAYRLSPKLVVRTGYGMFYGNIVNNGTNSHNTYPYVFVVTYPSPDPAHPIQFANGALGTLESGLTWFTGDPTTVNAYGISLYGAQTNFRNDYTMSYNFTLEYQLSPNQVFSLGYVGTQSRHLNLGTPGYDNRPSEILPPSATQVNYVPYPDFAVGSASRKTEGNAQYNALQANFERRLSQGLDILANYTYSKCRTDRRDELNNTIGSYRALTLPGFGIQGDYALCDFDIPQVVHLSGGYILPFGRGQRFMQGSTGAVSQLVTGWKMNWILTLQDGQPFGIPCANSTSEFGCYARLVPGQSVYGGPHNVNQWVNPAAFNTPPVATTVGQTDYSVLGGNPTEALGPGFHRMDFSLFKQFPLNESKRFEFRAEAFNLTNTPQFSNPNLLNYNNVLTFGRISSTRDGGYDQREIQFALKFYW